MTEPRQIWVGAYSLLTVVTRQVQASPNLDHMLGKGQGSVAELPVPSPGLNLCSDLEVC